MVRLCSVIGESFELLPHFISHYKYLGINSFHIIIHTTNTSKKELDNAIAVLNRYGISPEYLYDGIWNGIIGTSFINDILQRYQDSWFIISDLDEFQLYHDSLENIIKLANNNNTNFITGALIDRISKNGALTKIINNTTIWRQYPICGFISFPISRSNPYKITFCRGGVKLSEGQHGIEIVGEKYPKTNSVICQVHHFKWTNYLHNRIKSRTDRFNKGEFDNSYLGYIDELQLIKRFLNNNSNKINLNTNLFLLMESGNKYTDYGYWTKVQDIMKDWSQLQSYPLVK